MHADGQGCVEQRAQIDGLRPLTQPLEDRLDQIQILANLD
jgi:hypothetical protein